MMKNTTGLAIKILQILVVLFAIDALLIHLRGTSTSYPLYRSDRTTDSSSSSQSHISVPESDSKSTHAGSSTPHYHTYTYTSPDDDVQVYTLERTDDFEKFEQSVLFLTITRDAKSWGRNPTEHARTLDHHFDFITNTTLEAAQTSVALLTSSYSEFENFKASFAIYTAAYPFARVSLVYYPEPKEDGNRESRHDNNAQHARRSKIAQIRNYLMAVTLREETHLLWLDADVYKWSSNKMVADMIDKTTSSGEVDVGVLTARCQIGEAWRAEQWKSSHPHHDHDYKKEEDGKFDNSKEDGKNPLETPDTTFDPFKPRPTAVSFSHGTEKILKDTDPWTPEEKEVAKWKEGMGHYDLNAWSGPRNEPSVAELEGLHKDISSWTPSHASGNKILDAMIEGTTNDDVVRLDSVGGTVLMMRADLVRKGLNFPMGYYIGMTWKYGEGWDGIETEGVCLVSRSLSKDGKSMCYSMGGDWSVWHTKF